MDKVPHHRHIRIVTGVVLFALIAGLLVFYGFRRDIRCLRVKHSELEEVKPGLFIHPKLEPFKRQRLVYDHARVSDRLAPLFGTLTTEPRFIVAHSPALAQEYMDDPGMAAESRSFFLGPRTVVIGPELDGDALAQEWVRIELANRFGSHFKKLPIWFVEGIVKQMDRRDEIGFHAWAALPDEIRKKPLDSIDTPEEFFSNTEAHSAIARHESISWFQTGDKGMLTELINHLKNGGEFGPFYEKKRAAGIARVAEARAEIEAKQAEFDEQFPGVDIQPEPKNLFVPEEVERRIKEKNLDGE